MSEETPLPPPPPKNPDRDRLAPATGRPLGDPDRNNDVQRGGKRRKDRTKRG